MSAGANACLTNCSTATSETVPVNPISPVLSKEVDRDNYSLVKPLSSSGANFGGICSPVFSFNNIINCDLAIINRACDVASHHVEECDVNWGILIKSPLIVLESVQAIGESDSGMIIEGSNNILSLAVWNDPNTTSDKAFSPVWPITLASGNCLLSVNHAINLSPHRRRKRLSWKEAHEHVQFNGNQRVHPS